MRRSLSIGSKLSLAFGAGVLIAAVTSAMALWAVLRTQRSTDAAIGRVATVSRVSSELRSMQLAEDAYLTTGEASDLARFHAQCEAVEGDAARLAGLVDAPGERATLDDLVRLAREYRSQVDAQSRAMSGEAATDDPAALRAIVERKKALGAELDATSAGLVDTVIDRTAPQLVGSFRRMLGLFGAVAASMFLGFAFTSWVGRRIVSGLGGVIGEIHAMSASSRFDRQLSTRWNEEPNDEIGQLARAFNAMASAVAARQDELEGEMELARRIQTSILPRDLAVDNLDLAVRMVPASVVGGDYYDVLPAHDGAWLGIGDVAGHGLDAGLVMLMVQSIVSCLVRESPDALPSHVLARANEVVFDNVFVRLAKHQHTTLTLVRYRRDGRVTFAGAHEEILVVRAREGRVEPVATRGAWLGLVPNIGRHLPDAELRLEEGDLLVLYTDGLTEAADAAGEMFGSERLCAALERARHLPVDRVRDEVLGAVQRWTHEQRDDVTIVVARYHRDRLQRSSSVPALPPA